MLKKFIERDKSLPRLPSTLQLLGIQILITTERDKEKPILLNGVLSGKTAT